ncbi:jg27712 [Pararge aegeria aegeria]|uniref:Jg27712 protein n=1 Tax=Pararge aegeria aegeria TaxID=348720 RepID=A0A8S4R4F9_9NEOP|nr:jg27712 [Pararge aegeria aegeria]
MVNENAISPIERDLNRKDERSVTEDHQLELGKAIKLQGDPPVTAGRNAVSNCAKRTFTAEHENVTVSNHILAAGQTTSNELQEAAGSKQYKPVVFGTPCKRLMSSSGHDNGDEDIKR